MNRALLASLFVASTALAQPAAKCRPASGTPLVELDHDVRSGVTGETSQIKVYEGGAWTVTGTDAGGKPKPEQTGCLAKTDFAKLKADLKAPWTVKHNRIHCMMMTTTFTVFSLNGKEVFREMACNPDSLDDASAKKLADLQALLAAAHVGS